MMSKIKAPSNLEPILLSEESRLAKTKKSMHLLYSFVYFGLKVHLSLP